MSHTMKVWERIIETRLRDGVEISKQQYGFMPGKGTTDAIFATHFANLSAMILDQIWTNSWSISVKSEIYFIKSRIIFASLNSLKTGEPNLSSCHVTQSEQKKKHGKYFWLNFLKNPLLRHNTQENAEVPLYTAAL